MTEPVTMSNAQTHEASLLDQAIENTQPREFFETIKSSPSSTMDYLKLCTESLRLVDGNPKAIESAAFICGQQMIAEGLTFAELRMKYHIYPDALNLRAGYIHAALEKHGWQWTWKKDGEDGKEAVFSASKNGESHEVSFTIDQAKQKDLVKQKSAWAKDPAQMLRARCVTRFATMWEPSIGAGTQEDTDHGSQISIDEVAESVEQKPIPTHDQDNAKSSEQDGVDQITLDSRIAAIEFPKRAFTSFAEVEPKIQTLRDLCQFTRDELIAREKLGKGTVDQIEKLIGEHNISLAVSPSSTAGGETDGTSESRTDDATDSQGGDGGFLPEHPGEDQGNPMSECPPQLIAEIRDVVQSSGKQQEAMDLLKEMHGHDSIQDAGHLQALQLFVAILFKIGGATPEQVKATIKGKYDCGTILEMKLDDCKDAIGLLKKKLNL